MQDRSPTWFLEGLFSLCLHRVEWARDPSRVSFMEALILFIGFVEVTNSFNRLDPKNYGWRFISLYRRQ